LHMHEDSENNIQPMDILPVPLEQDLEPGESIKKKLWICAPHENVGDREFCLYFSYSIPFSIDKKPLTRLLKKNVSIKILPAVSIKPIQVNPCQYDDNRSQDVLIHMTNSSNDARNQIIDLAYVRQISMISETRILKGIVSSNENTPILHGETTVLGLMTALKDSSEDKEQSYSVDCEPKSSARGQKTSAEGFNFSTVQVNKDNEVAQLDLPPYINFLKGDFHFPSKQEGVQLKNDVIVIIWRTKTGRFGISHEALITNEDPINSPDVVDAGDVFRSTDSVDSPIVPVVKKPCRVRAIVSSKNLQHDFDKDPICLVPFKVEIDNYLPTPSIFRYKTEAHVCRFLGCTKASIPMPGQIKKTLSFHVAVSAPGLYSYGGLSFQMTQPGQECDDDEFIPLEVNFLVEQ